MLVQALGIYKHLLGEEHPHIAKSIANLAYLYDIQDRCDEAEPLYLQSIEMGKHLLGEKHPDVGISITNLAEFYRLQKRFAEARSLYRQALEIFELQLGQDHAYSVAVRSNLEQLSPLNL